MIGSTQKLMDRIRGIRSHTRARALVKVFYVPPTHQ